MDYAQKSLEMHRLWRGKLEVRGKAPVHDREALSLAYTPGVAQPCLEIQKDPDQSYALTGRGNTVAVITDGTAVLGLGDIGPEAAMPVMEGKCLLFKELGGIDAVPLCVRSREVDQIVQTAALLAGSFGGINLEDISAPRCFEVERRLKAICDIPVFHDDQHGTAIVILAGALNALQVVGKSLPACRVVVSGAGAAGTAAGSLLLDAGVADLIFCDRAGILRAGDPALPPHHAELARRSNPRGLSGGLAEALKGADLFIGVSAPGLVTPEMVRTMAPGAIVFACANPEPEIFPDAARAGGAAVVATGRSDFPNQINNVLAFPGVFRGALDVRAADINEAMKLAAARALAGLIPQSELGSENIIPSIFDPRVCGAVAAAVAQAARETGVSRV